MISSSNLHQFRNGEIIAFFSNVLSIFSEMDINKLGLKPQISGLATSFDVLKTQYKAERGSKITRTIVNLDRARDLLFVATRNILIQHAQAHPVEKLRPKAHALLEVIEKHGADLYKKSYQEQTVGMNDITKKIDQNISLISMIKDFHLHDYYEALKEANKTFNDKYLERNKTYSAQPNDSLKDLRIDGEDKFDKLVQRINAHIVLADDASDYQRLADQIDRLVETYQEAVNRRLSKDEKVSDEELDQDYHEVSE
ncbi:MAG: DUF6261 family protein [Bacteroidota bacterium]